MELSIKDFMAPTANMKSKSLVPHGFTRHHAHWTASFILHSSSHINQPQPTNNTTVYSTQSRYQIASKMNLYHALALVSLQFVAVRSFTSPGQQANINTIKATRSQRTVLYAGIGEAELKSELAKYLKKREDAGADEVAKSWVVVCNNVYINAFILSIYAVSVSWTTFITGK